MIDVTLDKPGEYHFVSAVDETGIRIGDTLYTSSIILTPEQVVDGWAPRSMQELVETHLQALFNLQPEVALLGTGPTQGFLSRQLMIRTIESGIGLEVMTTAAACRTFNILASDGRRVAAALMTMAP